MEEIQRPLLLRPYLALATGAGIDENGYFMAIVLMNPSEAVAQENAALLEQRISEAKNVVEMREWSEDAHEFEEVDFVIYGADDPVPEGREHKPDETPKKQPPAETPKPATPKPGAVASFGDMEQLMLLCCQSAEKTCPDSYTSMDKQKIAVTMFMQCDKRGITAEAIAAELVEKEFDTEPVETKEPQDDTEDGLPF